MTARVVKIRCPQCRVPTTARGTTARDAVLARHGRMVREQYLAVKVGGELVDVTTLGDLAEIDTPRSDPKPAVREVLDVCRFTGATVADARTGLTAYARSVIDRRAHTDEAIKESEAVRLAASPKADISASFIGTADVEDLDEEHEAAIAGPKVAVTVRPDTPPVEWVGAVCSWLGWECECKAGARGPVGHYRVALPEGERGKPIKDGEYADFKILIFKEVEVGHGAGIETVRTECPTWRPVRRSEVLNPHRGLSHTSEPGSSQEASAGGAPEADPRPEVLAVEAVTDPSGLPAAVRAVWDHAATCVRSTWALDGTEHTTVGVAGRSAAGSHLWWAYWKDGRFDSAFWGGWPVKVGQLKDLLSGRLAEPPRLDPDAPKIKKTTIKKPATSRRKDWVEA